MFNVYIFTEMECIICECTDDKKNLTHVKRGLNKLKEIADSLNDLNLIEKLRSSDPVHVHEMCRRNYTRRIPANMIKTKIAEPMKLRSSDFDFKLMCIFCGDALGKKKILRSVTTDEFKSKMLNACITRNDDWGLQIQSRIDDHDLVASDAKYHKQCYINFYNFYVKKNESKIFFIYIKWYWLCANLNYTSSFLKHKH